MALRTSLSALSVRTICAAAVLAVSLLAGGVRAAEQPATNVSPASPDPIACEPAPPPSGGNIWGAQPGLIAKCLALLPAGAADHPNVYAIAVAPLGTQTLFSREAHVALQRFAANYGGTAKRGILLSNGAADLMQVPLATQDNMLQVLRDIGRRMEPSPDDVLVIYLTSHGRQDAALASALPRNLPILAISADSLADALEQAHVRRRVIIISACFAGSWIPKLASDDAIILTAASADRTSFGCDDTRPLTYFGDAFLNGPLSRGASLAESFEGARKMVTQWEQEQKLLNSQPQFFVGKNMQAFWQSAPGGAAVPAKPVAVVKAANATRRVKPKQP